MNLQAALLLPICALGLLPRPTAGAQDNTIPAPQIPLVADLDAATQRADFAREYGVVQGDEIDPIGGEILGRALHGKKLPASAWGELRIESMADVLEREKAMGTGSFEAPNLRIIPAPRGRDGASSRHAAKSMTQELDPTGNGTTSSSFLGGGGTAPTFLQEFSGPRIGDPGVAFLVPDSCCAVGMNHFCAVVNENISIYDKSGNRLQSVSLLNFFGVNFDIGDPRIAYDYTHDRWCVIATDFGEHCWLGYSLTGDPLGPWVKTAIDLVDGSDAGRRIDFPTLGVDSRGIFIGAYMVGIPERMTIFAIDKAPLLAASPALGTVTAFRSLSWDGAIQHATQYTDAGQSYMISTRTSNSLRLRRINLPLTSPTLTTSVISGIPTYSPAGSAPALGSPVNISTLDTRLNNACYINGSIWAAHTVDSGGKSGARWYQIDPAAETLTQSGTLTDPSLWFYYPAIAADANGNAVMGFNGSDSSTYPSAYFSGRLGTDPAGEMAPATLYSAGQNSFNYVDSFGRNRWGDYSQTCLDPVDGTFWTIQERTPSQADRWVTSIAQVEYGTVCGGITRYCTAAANPTGNAAVIDTVGSSSIAANDLVLFATNLPLLTFGLFFYGQSQASAPAGDGTLCIGNPFFRTAPVQATLFGDATFAFDNTAQTDPAGQIMVGETWNFSFWYRQASPAGFNFSDALSIQFCD